MTTILRLRAVYAAVAILVATISATAFGSTADTADWRQAQPRQPLPAPRDAPSLSYDASRHAVVLFGGKGANSRYFDDVWTYDGQADSWTEANPSGLLPPGRFGQAQVYDSASKKTIVFGGVTTSALANDTWAYDAGADAWSRLGGSGPRPVGRLYPSLAYDESTGKAILFGGWNGRSAYGDTWSLDPANGRWTRLRPHTTPPARWGAALVYDAVDRRLILFGGLHGGYDGRDRFGDTWAYDPARNTWTNLHPRGPAPPARGYAAAAYDTTTHTILVFGGFAGPGGLLGDTWSYDPHTNRWSSVRSATSPSRRDFSAAAYDAAAQSIVLFGGLTGDQGNIDGTLLDDTWLRPSGTP